MMKKGIDSGVQTNHPNKADYGYPQPVRSPDNAVYLDGWKEGKLMLQKCCECKKPIFFPRPMCPHCWSDQLEWIQSTGRGEVVSYSLIHRPNHPSFNDEVPIALAEIVLDEGVALLARVLEATPSTGMKVNLATESEVTSRYPLPVFRPET